MEKTIPFEYFTFTLPDVDIKSEPILPEDSDLGSPSAIDPIRPIGNETKCGSIFISSTEKYTFICEFCNDRFEDLQGFGEHLQSRHFKNDFKVPVATEAGANNEVKAEFLEKEFNGCIEDALSANESQANIKLGQAAETTSPSKTVVYDVNSEMNKAASTNEITRQSGNCENPGVFVKPQLFDFNDDRMHCNICNYTFNSKSTYSCHKNRHINLGMGPTRPKRGTPTPAYRAKMRLAAETKTPSTGNEPPGDPNLYCDICYLYFKTSQAIKLHAVQKHGDLIPKVLQIDISYLKCTFCHQEFSKPTERYSHESTHNEEKRYLCSHCPRMFRTRHQRLTHENTHTGANPFQCPHCPKAFKSHINRLQHIRGHLNIKRFSCEFCDMKFITNVQRRLHIRTHTQEKPYQCEECGKRFRASGALLYHKKRHANVKDCKCEICGKMFLTNSHVKRHRVVHTSERPLKCSECGKTFQRPNALRAHQLLHSDEKRYECNLCGKKFAQCAGLHSHRKTHSKEI